MLAYVDSIDLDYSVINQIATLKLLVTEKSTAGTQHQITIRPEDADVIQTVGSVFRRWGKQINDRNYLTVKIALTPTGARLDI